MFAGLNRVGRVGRFAVAVACVACSASTSPVAVSISVTAEGNSSLEMIVGDRVPLTVTVTNDQGEVVQGLGPPVFVSRNPDVVGVDSTGLASANHVGSTLVVVTETAADRILSDSIHIGVAQVVGDEAGGTGRF